jgi:hypothetical protein
MKAPFRVKVKRSGYETKYEIAGEPPHGFSASGFVFGVLDDAQIKKLIRAVITAPLKPPGYFVEMAEAVVAHLVDMYERFDLESYLVSAELGDGNGYLSLDVSLYVDVDEVCGGGDDDGAPPCRLVAAAEAACGDADEHHEVAVRVDVGDAERGIADRAAVRRVALSAIRHVYNAYPDALHVAAYL